MEDKSQSHIDTGNFTNIERALVRNARNSKVLLRM